MNASNKISISNEIIVAIQALNSKSPHTLGRIVEYLREFEARLEAQLSELQNKKKEVKNSNQKVKSLNKKETKKQLKAIEEKEISALKFQVRNYYKLFNRCASKLFNDEKVDAKKVDESSETPLYIKCAFKSKVEWMRDGESSETLPNLDKNKNLKVTYSESGKNSGQVCSCKLVTRLGQERSVTSKVKRTTNGIEITLPKGYFAGNKFTRFFTTKEKTKQEKILAREYARTIFLSAPEGTTKIGIDPIASANVPKEFLKLVEDQIDELMKYKKLANASLNKLDNSSTLKESLNALPKIGKEVDRLINESNRLQSEGAVPMSKFSESFPAFVEKVEKKEEEEKKQKQEEEKQKQFEVISDSKDKGNVLTEALEQVGRYAADRLGGFVKAVTGNVRESITQPQPIESQPQPIESSLSGDNNDDSDDDSDVYEEAFSVLPNDKDYTFVKETIQNSLNSNLSFANKIDELLKFSKDRERGKGTALRSPEGIDLLDKVLVILIRIEQIDQSNKPDNEKAALLKKLRAFSNRNYSDAVQKLTQPLIEKLVLHYKPHKTESEAYVEVKNLIKKALDRNDITLSEKINKIQKNSSDRQTEVLDGSTQSVKEIRLIKWVSGHLNNINNISDHKKHSCEEKIKSLEKLKAAMERSTVVEKEVVDLVVSQVDGVVAKMKSERIKDYSLIKKCIKAILNEEGTLCDKSNKINEINAVSSPQGKRLCAAVSSYLIMIDSTVNDSSTLYPVKLQKLKGIFELIKIDTDLRVPAEDDVLKLVISQYRVALLELQYQEIKGFISFRLNDQDEQYSEMQKKLEILKTKVNGVKGILKEKNLVFNLVFKVLSYLNKMEAINQNTNDGSKKTTALSSLINTIEKDEKDARDLLLPRFKATMHYEVVKDLIERSLKSKPLEKAIAEMDTKMRSMKKAKLFKSEKEFDKAQGLFTEVLACFNEIQSTVENKRGTLKNKIDSLNILIFECNKYTSVIADDVKKFVVPQCEAAIEKLRCEAVKNRINDCFNGGNLESIHKAINDLQSTEISPGLLMSDKEKKLICKVSSYLSGARTIFESNDSNEQKIKSLEHTLKIIKNDSDDTANDVSAILLPKVKAIMNIISPPPTLLGFSVLGTQFNLFPLGCCSTQAASQEPEPPIQLQNYGHLVK